MAQEVETMSQATSPSTGQPYGLARVCRVWGVACSTAYWQRRTPAPCGTRRGPMGPCTDDELVDHTSQTMFCVRPRLHAVRRLAPGYQSSRCAPMWMA